MDIADSTVNDTKSSNRVICVNRFYWPDDSATSQLLTDLAENLSASGMHVVIVTSRLSYANPRKRLPARANRNGVEIRRVRTTGFDRASLVGRALDFLTFYVSATVALMILVKPHDIVIAKTDPPLIQLFAWLAVKVKGGRIVNWCQDLFPEVAYALTHRQKPGILGTALYSLRNFVLRNSEMNVTISNEMSKTLVIQGLEKKRVQVIRNWCDPTISPIAHGTNPLRRQWQLTDCLVLGYSGNLGRAHLPDKVLLLIGQLAGIANLKFLFIGAGHGMKWLMQQCQNAGFDNVIFKPYQPRDTLSLSLSVPDLHLVSLRSGCQQFLAPSKYYGILAAGRPVVFLGDEDCELAKEIEQSELGIALDANHVGSWHHKIQKLIDDKIALSSLGINARKAYEERFSSRQSLAAWRNILEPNDLSEGLYGTDLITMPKN